MASSTDISPIVRDPRVLVSRLLYRAYGAKSVTDPEHSERYLDLLRATDHYALSVLRIF